MTHRYPEHTAVFAGSFNPFTIGHKAIVEKALKIFDHIIIAIGVNADKNEVHESAEQRAADIRNIFTGDGRIDVEVYSGLTVDFCRETGVSTLVRGVRDVTDFEYERRLAEINRNISEVETVILLSPPGLSHISSSMVRELQSYGRDITPYIP